MKTNRGFSLIELLIVVAIIAILSAIAIPAYQDYLLRGKITDATSTLSTKRTKMELYFQDSRTYAGAPDCTPDTTSSQNFNFSCSVAGTTTVYTLQAVGKAGMSGFTYTIDQSGAKTTTIAAPAPSGWVAASPNNCWVTRKGGVC